MCIRLHASVLSIYAHTFGLRVQGLGFRSWGLGMHASILSIYAHTFSRMHVFCVLSMQRYHHTSAEKLNCTYIPHGGSILRMYDAHTRAGVCVCVASYIYTYSVQAY